MSFWVMGSLKVRPIRRLMAKKVCDGLVTAWRLAGWPTRRSPSSVKATIDGVVRAPSAFSITFGCAPSMTATQELVVPRSIPMTLPMAGSLTFKQTAEPQKQLGPWLMLMTEDRPAPSWGVSCPGADIRRGAERRKTIGEALLAL